MIQLIYSSSAVDLISDQELKKILQVARERNARDNITGLLLYKSGNFIQALEGPEEAVLKLYEKIQQDPRHTSIMTLVKEPIQARQFPDWSMGFQNVEKLDATELPGFSTFLNESFTPEALQQKPSRALVLLQTFKNFIR